MRRTLIAPCGMNCRLCMAYARAKNPCPGCRGDDSVKAKTRVRCSIKNCEWITRKRTAYCFQCDRFPCERLIHLDRRYRTKYGMSMIENLANMRRSGIRRFLGTEEARWACPGCGRILCVHMPECQSCGYRWR